MQKPVGKENKRPASRKGAWAHRERLWEVEKGSKGVKRMGPVCMSHLPVASSQNRPAAFS